MDCFLVMGAGAAGMAQILGIEMIFRSSINVNEIVHLLSVEYCVSAFPFTLIKRPVTISSGIKLADANYAL
jgi:hypothetical protein